MLSDPDCTRGHTERGTCLLSAEPRDDAKKQDLAVRRRELFEQRSSDGGFGSRNDGVLGTRAVCGAIRKRVRDVAAVTETRALRVGDLVPGDAVDESSERTALIDVARQGGENRHEDLLCHVVRRPV